MKFVHARRQAEILFWMVEGPPRTRADIMERWEVNGNRASRVIHLLLDINAIRFHNFRPHPDGTRGNAPAEYVPVRRLEPDTN